MKGCIDADGWVRCPICGNKTRTKVYQDTELKNYPLYCSKCRSTHIINVRDNRVISIEPDAKTQSR